MKNIKQLIKAIKNKTLLVWNDPEQIKGNDYTISFIEEVDEYFDEDTPILIQYNGGLSEAEVFLHEISAK